MDKDRWTRIVCLERQGNAGKERLDEQGVLDRDDRIIAIMGNVKSRERR